MLLILLANVAGQAEEARPELVLQAGHTMRIEAVAFGGAGKWLASGSADNTVKLWDTETGRELRTMSGETGWVKSVAVSPDSKLVAAGNLKGAIKIWDVGTGNELRNITGHAGSVTALAFSPDGATLASGGVDRTIKLWDVATGAEKKTLSGHKGWITALAFNSNGETLASGSADTTVKLWVWATGEAARTLTGHAGKINSLTFSSDGNHLASASADATAKVWSVASGREERTLKGNASPMLLVAFDANDATGKTLITGSANKIFKFWDATTGVEKRALDDSASYETVETIAFDARSRRFALGTGNKLIQLWNADGKQAGDALVRTLDSISSSVFTTAFSPDNRWFAFAGKDRTIKIWEVATGRNVMTLKGHTGWVTSVAFNPDGTLLAAGSLSGVIKIWNVESGDEKFSFTNHKESVNRIAFSADGKSLASGSGDGTVKLWDTQTGRETRTFTGHTGEVHAVAFSPDGRTIISGGTDKIIRVWDVNSGTQTREVRGHDGIIYALAFASNGKQFASGGADKNIKIWDATTFAETATLAGHNVMSLAFSSNDALLASGGTDGTARVWNIASGKETYKLSGHTGAVNGVAFTLSKNNATNNSANNAGWLMSASEDGSCRLWDARTGGLAATLVTLAETNEWIVVAPDGLFDGSPVAWNSILWRFANNTFAVAPVEAFFTEFYEPNLLAAILAGKNPRAPQSITQKDRRQPNIRIALTNTQPGASVAADNGVATRAVKVKLDLTEALPDATHKFGSGVRDVRLFRNGTLVKVWRSDVPLERGATTLEADVPVVAGVNQLTVYAFNRDNVKSPDRTISVTGAESLRRTGTAYIVAVGVNEYSNAGYNLKFAVPDAEDFSEEVRQSQRDLLNRFSKVEVVSLHNKEATKANILAALNNLAGDKGQTMPAQAIPADALPPQLAALKAVQPEDAVVFYFAGHGVANKSRFYLLPHDLGYKGSRRRLDAAGFQTILAHGVSDQELESAFERIDAGQLLFVIDACNSGQALEAEEKRRGPMNSKGLAQLAYEKGMFILTAAQSYQAALEVAELGHGLLTYTLVEEGLKQNMADTAPRDGRVLLAEWLDYATQRVPQIQQEKMNGSRNIGTANVSFVEGEEAEQDPARRNIQRPRVFYRRDTPVPIIAVSAGTTQAAR